MLVAGRHHPVVEDLGRSDRRLAVIELGEGHLDVGIDDGLLIDPPDPFQRTDIKVVLRPAITRPFAVELAVRLLVGLGLLVLSTDVRNWTLFDSKNWTPAS